MKLRRYLLCSCVAARHGTACAFYAVQNAQAHSAQHATHSVFTVISKRMHAVRNAHVHSAQHAISMPFNDMLPHNRTINNDVIPPNVLT